MITHSTRLICLGSQAWITCVRCFNEVIHSRETTHFSIRYQYATNYRCIFFFPLLPGMARFMSLGGPFCLLRYVPSICVGLLRWISCCSLSYLPFRLSIIPHLLFSAYILSISVSFSSKCFIHHPNLFSQRVNIFKCIISFP